MEWYFALLLILGVFMVMMSTGMPVAFCFMVVSIMGIFIWWGGTAGMGQLVVSVYSSVTSIPLLCIPLYILMGEVMFQSGVAPNMISALDKWMGRMPGRLSLLAVASGTLIATFTGSSIGSTALLGEVLVPEMYKRGYKPSMALGPILGSGGLAMMIPPSGLAVFLGVVAEISIGKILIAIILPGILMAVNYAIYIIVRCYLQPSLAPPYETPPMSFREKLMPTLKHVLPLGFVIFMVIGLMLLGIATPTEAAASGALACFVLAAAYGKLNWKILKTSIRGTLKITVMFLMILVSATAFSQVLAFSGASRGLSQFVLSLSLSPILVFISMLVVNLFLGMFMSSGAVILVSIPLFMPIVHALGFSEVWFAVVQLIGIEIGTTSPPYGMGLFVMQSIAPKGTTYGDCVRAALPFIYCNIFAVALIVIFPQIATWLPSVMG